MKTAIQSSRKTTTLPDFWALPSAPGFNTRWQPVIISSNTYNNVVLRIKNSLLCSLDSRGLMTSTIGSLSLLSQRRMPCFDTYNKLRLSSL
jgi:hypothetical protein